MATAYLDITRKLQEFGFGLTDSDTDEAEDEDIEGSELSRRASITSDWESIGLLPSLQKIQITFRNASYNFMTGLRRDTDSPKTKSGEDDDSASIKNDAPADETNEPPMDEMINRSEIHSALSDLDATIPGIAPVSADGNSKEDAEDADVEDADEEDESEEEEGEENEEDAEWESIGRLPRFNQLQFSLRGASEFTSKLVPGDSSSLGERVLALQNLVPNFQLPSFFEEPHSSDELEDINDPQLAPIFSEVGITEEDREVRYNEEGLTGCKHYLRSCKTECAECLRFYSCQICHDETDQSHHMDRRLTKRMLCLYCQRPQAPHRKCRFCSEVMGDYYCRTCKLWNDDPDKSIYHCDKCGICRVGKGPGIDVFHCDKCGVCLNIEALDNHTCIEQASRSDCPICLEDLFLSSEPTVFMPCGHPIHRHCFDEYSKRYYRCPVCAKSILNTGALFRMIDEEIRNEVLPPELADKQVDIICQDCRLKSRAPYHLAGLKCDTCGSYNTAQI